MAAQDYFSRLQMSGLTGSDIASLQALSGLTGYPNMNLNSSPSSSSTGGGNNSGGGGKNNNNSKRKEKSQNDSYDKYASSMDVKKLSASKEAAANMQQHLKNSNNYSQQSFPNTAANLQKDFFAMAASLDPKSLNDYKNAAAAAMQAGSYVPNKNSNVNHNQMRSGGSNNSKESNNRKASKDGNGTDNNYSSKRGNNDHSSYQNLFKESK